MTKGKQEKDESRLIKEEAKRTWKIGLNLTTGQKLVINEWMNTARWAYNTAVAYCKTYYEEYRTLPTPVDLAGEFLHENVAKEKGLEWSLRTPYDIRDEAMRDVLRAYKSNFAKRDINPEHTFEIKFKSKKKMLQDSIKIKRQYFNNQKLYPRNMQQCLFNLGINEKIEKISSIFEPRILKSGLNKKLRKRKAKEMIPNDIVYDSRLIKTKLGQYYFTLLKPIEQVPENQRPVVQNCIALDPGVRTFQSGYDIYGNYFEWGKNDCEILYKSLLAWDKVLSKRMSKDIRAKQRRKLKLLGARIRQNIKNKIRYQSYREHLLTYS